jgi:uncharacterized Zn-binding protein involved in type VI secretion
MAARVGDPTAHGGVLAPPGIPNVLIAGAPAMVVGPGIHPCPMPPPAGPHPPGPLTGPGSSTVLIGGFPAARQGDMTACAAPILSGAPTVMIGG